MKNKSSNFHIVLVFIALLIVFIFFSVLFNSVLLNYEFPIIGQVGDKWSNSSDFTSATLGIAIAVSGAFVAILIAHRTADVADRTDTREVYLIVDGLIGEAARQVKSSKEAIESITNYSLIVADLLERSKIFKYSKVSVEIKDLNFENEITIDAVELTNSSSGYSGNVDLTENLKTSEDGRLLSTQLSNVFSSITDEIIVLVNNTTELLSSEPVTNFWFNNFKNFVTNRSESKADTLNECLEDVYFIFCGKKLNCSVEEMDIDEFKGFIRNIAFELKFSAHKLKFAIIDGRVDVDDAILPMLEAANKVYDHKLRNYVGVEYKEGLKHQLDALDLLTVNTVLCADYDNDKYKNRGLGNICFAILYLLNSPFEMDEKLDSDERSIISLLIANFTVGWDGFPNDSKALLKSKYKSDFLSISSYAHEVIKSTLDDVTKLWNEELFFFESFRQGIDDILLQDSRNNKFNKSELELKSRIEDFFEANKVFIRDIKVEASLLSQKDVLEPIFLLGIGQGVKGDLKYKKSTDALLYFARDTSVVLHYNQSDELKVESLFLAIYNRYFDKDRGHLDLTDLVVTFRKELEIDINGSDVTSKVLGVFNDLNFPRFLDSGSSDKLNEKCALTSQNTEPYQNNDDGNYFVSRRLLVKQYAIEKNDENEILISFYKVTERDFVSGCSVKNFYFKGTDLYVELIVNEKYRLEIVFNDLGNEAKEIINSQKAIMLLEINKNETELPYHYVATKNLESKS